MHRELLRRYGTDGAFRGVEDATARGLGLRVLDALDTGRVLAADADSPFAFRLADYRQNLTVEDRLCHGMVQIAIAAGGGPSRRARGRAQEIVGTEALRSEGSAVDPDIPC